MEVRWDQPNNEPPTINVIVGGWLCGVV